MKKIKRIGTSCLILFMVLGFLITLFTATSYMLRIKGFTNNYIEWFTQNSEVDLNWIDELRGKYSKYEKEKTVVERYKSIIRGMENTIEDFCTSCIPEMTSIKYAADVYRTKVLNNNLKWGISGKTNREYVEEAIFELEDFNSYLLENDIDFVYVQLPRVERIKAYQERGKEYPSELEISDLFASELNKTDIEFINMSSEYDVVRKFKVDSSNHWFPTNALQTTEIIADYLNANKDYSFNLDIFDVSNYHNLLVDFPELMESIKSEKGYIYEMPVPNNSPLYEVDYCETNLYHGFWNETQLRASDRWSVDGPYHEMWTISNGVFVKINNLSGTNNQKKILVLGDSFSWPITSYISQDVDTIAAIYPSNFNGSIRKYIEEYKPDTVLMMFFEGQVGYNDNATYLCLD